MLLKLCKWIFAETSIRPQDRSSFRPAIWELKSLLLHSYSKPSWGKFAHYFAQSYSRMLIAMLYRSVNTTLFCIHHYAKQICEHHSLVHSTRVCSPDSSQFLSWLHLWFNLGYSIENNINSQTMRFKHAPGQQTVELNASANGLVISVPFNFL